MANFIFEKYSTKLEYYAYRISRETITSTTIHESMYRGVSLNTETGKWYASTPTFVTIKPGSYLTGYTWAGDNRITRRYDGTADQLEVIYDGVRSRYVKDTFIENVIGTDAEYPLDGRAGGYWYIRTNQLNDIAIITQPNGGETLDKEYEIKWTRTATDTNTDIEISFNNGLTWKRIASNTEGTNYTYDFTNEQETSIARIRTRAIKGEAVGSWNINSGVFTILHDFAPQAPTGLSPSSVILSREDIIRLSWQHNHPNDSSKFDLRWSTDQINWNDISRTNTNQYLDVAAETFTEGDIYWQVKTYSDSGISSTWSNVAVFTAAQPSDAPIITSANSTILARPVISWSQGDQASYQIQILNSINNVVWDTGEVASVNKAVTIGIDLLNNSTYTIKVRTKTALGLWTEYASQVLTVSFTDPATPTFTLTEEDYSIRLDIINPEPTSPEPAVAYNDVYRNGIRIATNISNSYVDNNIASGIEYNYQVVAVGENGTITQSIFHSGQISLKSSIINDMADNIIELRTDPNRQENNYYQGGKLHFAGRKIPVMQFEEFEDNNLALSFVLYEEGQLNQLKDIVSKKETILYRDNRGRKIFGIIRGLSISDDIKDKNWYGVSFTVEQVDYNEVV